MDNIRNTEAAEEIRPGAPLVGIEVRPVPKHCVLLHPAAPQADLALESKGHADWSSQVVNCWKHWQTAALFTPAIELQLLKELMHAITTLPLHVPTGATCA